MEGPSSILDSIRFMFMGLPSASGSGLEPSNFRSVTVNKKLQMPVAAELRAFSIQRSVALECGSTECGVQIAEDRGQSADRS